MAQRLKLLQPRYTVITVAGTNGKGSHVAMLDTAYRLAGYRVGTYTSPHLVHYNERIKLAGEPVADDVICRAFTQVEAARGEIPLTFFEFGTLAALVIFAEAAPDIAILEVGMGGRLDAVNMLDADAAVIATLDIDHVEWLGGTRELIAREKAGILRSGRPAVCSDPEAPASLLAYADEQAVPLALLGVDYHFSEQGERWSWWSGAVSLPDLPRPALSGNYQLRNAAGVLKVIDLLQSRHPVTGEQLADAAGLDVGSFEGGAEHAGAAVGQGDGGGEHVAGAGVGSELGDDGHAGVGGFFGGIDEAVGTGGFGYGGGGCAGTCGVDHQVKEARGGESVDGASSGFDHHLVGVVAIGKGRVEAGAVAVLEGPGGAVGVGHADFDQSAVVQLAVDGQGLTGLEGCTQGASELRAVVVGGRTVRQQAQLGADAVNGARDE